MFKNLLNFSYKRSGVEAVGFYLAYFLLILLVAFLFGGLCGVIFPDHAAVIGYRIGVVLAVCLCLYLSFLILVKKSLLNHYGYLLLAILSGILAVFGGGILGLIPVAFLTTRKKQQKNK
jgi:hypothetical protein